ncbi:MAG: hypothetical protein P8Y61_14730, partial [Gammaproteobacteria bacterium]
MKRLILAVVTAFFVPASAFAGLVAYEYEGTSYDGAWTVSGSIVFDEANLEAGVELINKIESWEFSWTNGSKEFSRSSEGSQIVGGDGDPLGRPEPTFIIDATRNIVTFSFESGPEFYPRVGFENTGLIFNITDQDPEFCCYQGGGSFSGPVPLPPTVVFVDVDIKPG